jgi:hypothetical protein
MGTNCLINFDFSDGPNLVTISQRTDSFTYNVLPPLIKSLKQIDKEEQCQHVRLNWDYIASMVASDYIQHCRKEISNKIVRFYQEDKEDQPENDRWIIYRYIISPNRELYQDVRVSLLDSLNIHVRYGTEKDGTIFKGTFREVSRKRSIIYVKKW